MFFKLVDAFTVNLLIQYLPIVFCTFSRCRYSQQLWTDVDSKVSCSTLTIENRWKHWHRETKSWCYRNVSSGVRVHLFAWISRGQNVWCQKLCGSRRSQAMIREVSIQPGFMTHLFHHVIECMFPSWLHWIPRTIIPELIKWTTTKCVSFLGFFRNLTEIRDTCLKVKRGTADQP